MRYHIFKPPIYREEVGCDHAVDTVAMSWVQEMQWISNFDLARP